MGKSSICILILCGLCAAGCGSNGPGTVKDDDPALKIPAIKTAARNHDRSAIPQLIKDLESDDPAVRFYSIDGLQRLTGQTLGYRYYDDDEARKAAIQRWHRWAANQPVASR